MGPDSDSDSASNPNGGWGGRAQGLFVKAAVLIGGAVLLKRLTKSKTRWDHARIVADSLSGEKVLPSSTSILLSSFQFQLHFFSHFKENYLLNLFILLWPGGWNSFRKNRHREILIISSTSGAFFIFLLICIHLIYALEYWIVFGNKFVFFFLFFIFIFILYGNGCCFCRMLTCPAAEMVDGSKLLYLEQVSLTKSYLLFSIVLHSFFKSAIFFKGGFSFFSY